jgi:hypothetical protein
VTAIRARHILAGVALAAAVAGCSRRVVIAPSQVPARNDIDWSVRSAPATAPPVAAPLAAPPLAAPPLAAPTPSAPPAAIAPP